MTVDTSSDFCLNLIFLVKFAHGLNLLLQKRLFRALFDFLSNIADFCSRHKDSSSQQICLFYQ